MSLSKATADRASREGVCRIGRPFRESPVGDEDPTFGYRRPGVSAANRHAPAIFLTVRQELLDNAELAPNGVPLRFEPLRLVGGVNRGQCEREQPEEPHQPLTTKSLENSHVSGINNPDR